uniref:Uncharacterized protein n=1 Tax=Arundo donax TaxID=35708 RepID=A0A0A9GSU5_ARUDO
MVNKKINQLQLSDVASKFHKQYLVSAKKCISPSRFALKLTTLM